MLHQLQKHRLASQPPALCIALETSSCRFQRAGAAPFPVLLPRQSGEICGCRGSGCISRSIISAWSITLKLNKPSPLEPCFLSLFSEEPQSAPSARGGAQTAAVRTRYPSSSGPVLRRAPSGISQEGVGAPCSCHSARQMGLPARPPDPGGGTCTSLLRTADQRTQGCLSPPCPAPPLPVLLLRLLSPSVHSHAHAHTHLWLTVLEKKKKTF